MVINAATILLVLENGYVILSHLRPTKAISFQEFNSRVNAIVLGHNMLMAGSPSAAINATLIGI